MTSPSPTNGDAPWLQYYPEWTAHSLEYGNRTLNDLYDDNLATNGNNTARSTPPPVAAS